MIPFRDTGAARVDGGIDGNCLFDFSGARLPTSLISQSSPYFCCLPLICVSTALVLPRLVLYRPAHYYYNPPYLFAYLLSDRFGRNTEERYAEEKKSRLPRLTLY